MLNGRKSFNLVKSHEQICHFIILYLVTSLTYPDVAIMMIIMMITAMMAPMMIFIFMLSHNFFRLILTAARWNCSVPACKAISVLKPFCCDSWKSGGIIGLLGWDSWSAKMTPTSNFMNHKKQNLPGKLGQQSTFCWNSLGLFRDYRLNCIFLGIKVFCFSRYKA